MNWTVYDNHYEAVLKYILYMTNDEQLAHDLLQETFLKFYSLRVVVAYPRTYLMKIARNLLYDHYRKKRLIQFLTIQHDTRIDESPMPSIILERNEENQLLYQALQKLPLKYRETIMLRYIEEYSVKETAAILGCNETKVKNHTARGLRELRKYLEGGDFNVTRTAKNASARTGK